MPLLRKLVVVDAAVADIWTLPAQWQADTDCLLLSAGQDPIAQITEAIERGQPYGEIHIFSHGEPGQLWLGGQPLDQVGLGRYGEALQLWAQRLRGASLWLYGCRVAAGEVGQRFVAMLHQLTGAAIAASTTPVGAAALGGNWELDYSLGSPAGSLPIALKRLQSYPALLAAPTIADSSTAPRTTPEETGLSITGVTIADDDGEPQSVTLSVTNGALNLASITGLIALAGDGTSSISFSGSLADINAAINGLSYTPTLDYNGSDSLTLTTNDGVLNATRVVALSVTAVNDSPLASPTAVSVDEGGQVTFADANFGITDVDNIATQIIIKLVSLPTKGYLTHGGAPVVAGSTFSSDQITQLRYFHDGTQTTAAGGTSDSFSVSIDDGAGGFIANTTIPIAIAPINQPPALNGTATVFEGQTNYLLPFAIVDPDQTTPHSVELLSLPADGVLKVNGVDAVVGQILTSADLTNLTYSHDGNDDNGGLPPNDGFNVRITDDGGGTGTPAIVDTTYVIKVQPNNDDPTLVNNTGAALTGATGRSITLTSAQLQVSDPDSSNQQLTYTVTALPSQGLLLKNGAQLPTGSSFTQADIDAGRISYLFSENAGAGTTDSFTFIVRDSELRSWPSLREGGIYPDATSNTLLPITFALTVDPTTPPGPGLGGDQGGYPAILANSPPTGNANGGAGIVAAGAQLNEAGSVVIDSTQLSVSDADNSPDQVIYRVLGLPRSGALQLNGRTLNLYDSFSQADINGNLLSFVHGGDEIFDDKFSFTLSDGNTVVTNNGNPFEFALTVTPINDRPAAVVSGNPFVKEGESVVINNARLTLQDPDGKGEIPLTPASPDFAVVNTLTFRVTTLPQYGQLTLDGVAVTLATVISEADLNGNKLVYTHDGSEQFSDFLEVQVNDNTDGLGATNNLSTIQRVTIDIAKVNDDPVFFSSIDLKVAEGEKGTIFGSGYAPGAAHLIYTDPDNTTIQRQYRITTNVAYGRLTLNGNRLGVGSVFTQDDLDQGRIEYQHDDSENFSDSFSFGVRDGGGAVVPGTYNILVDPTVNDAPVVAAPTQPQQFDTATPFVFSTANGNAITISDPDLLSVDAGEVDFIRVTLDVQSSGSTYTASTLTLPSTTGLTITGSNGAPGGVLVLAGKLADVQAALNGLSVQVPTDEDRTLQLVVTADDRIDPTNPALLNNGGRDPVGATAGYNIVSRTIDLNASNVNDAPTIAAPAAVALNEDGSLVFNGANGITIADLDDFGAPLTVTLAVDAGTGRLNLPGATGNNTATVTLTGTKAAINTALALLTYTPTADYNGTPTLTITANDNGNTGVGGSQTTVATVPITVNPLNDQPLLTVPGQQIIATSTTLSFGAGAIAIDDPKDLPYADPSFDLFSVTVSAKRESNSAPFGTLSATAQGSVGITNNGTDTVVITGSKADVNATLDTLTYTPDNFNIDDRIRIAVTVDDGNNGAEGTGSVGEPTTRNDSFLVNISGVNDPPVLTAPTNPLVVTEDTALAFTGAGNVFSFTDSDDFGATNLEATVTVTQGTLSLVANDGTTVSGSGTTTLTLVGSKLAINNALDGLIFTPTANYHGTAQITATINDKGNLGTGGEQTDSETLTITVNPANDRPVASGSITLVVGTEDVSPAGATLATLVATNNNYSDITDDQTGSGGGTTETALSHVAIVGSTNYVAGQGSWQVSDGSGGWITIPPTGLSATAALVFPASREIRFVPAPDFHGTPGTLSVRLADSSTAISVSASAGTTYNLSTNGGTGVAGAWSLGEVAIATPNVAPMNDAPVILNPATPATLASVNEDSTNPSGATVTALLGGKYSDVIDNQSGILGGGNTTTPLTGIAITANPANAITEGVWQYNTGASWVAVPTNGLSDSSALVIPATAQLRFVPVANYNGTPGGLTVRLSDGLGFTAGSSVDISGQLGTTNGWSAGVTTLNTAITPVNDAPLLDNSPNLTFGAVTEDAGAPTGTVGVLVSSLTAGISDIDGGAVQGIAVVGIQQGNLWYSTNNGASWQSAGQPTATTSRLLAADAQTRLFFRPSANVNGSFNALTIRAWDQTSGTNGGTANASINGGITAFSTATDTIQVTVNPLNDAPTRTVATTTLLASPEDTPSPEVRTIAQLFGGTFSDATDNQTALGGSAANTLAGVAVTDNGSTAAQGTWQYSINGTTWSDIGVRSLGSALRLAADTQVRFLPATNFNGTPGSLTARLIDSSGGVVTAGAVVNLSAGSATGGTTPYSNNGNAVTLNTSVTAINDAPLASGTATIVTLDEDPASVAGNLVSGLVTPNFNDNTDQVTTAVSGGSAANPLAGIAIVGNAAITEGIWQYSTNGTTWIAVGTPTSASALLVSATHSLRFVPAADYNGPVPVLTAHLIDNSAGAVTTGNTLNLTTGGAIGGTTAYSAATVPIGGTINPVNDAPQMSGTVAATFTEGNAAQLVATGLAVSDVDATQFNGGSLTAALGSYFSGDRLAIQAVGDGPGQINLSGSTITYEGSPIGTFAGGNGSNLVITFTTANATTAAVKALIERLTYASTSDDPTLTGSQPTRALTLTLSDGGNTGSGGPKTAQINGTITVVAVDDPPVNAVPGTQTFDEDTALTFSAANGNAIAISDPDAGSQTVQATLSVTNGALTLATLAGLSFITGDGTADSTFTFQGTITAINAALNGLVFAPAANYFGPATLTLTTDDLGNTGSGGPLSDTDLISLTINSVNDPPVAVNDGNSLSEDAIAPATGNVLPNDTDVENDGLTVTQIQHGATTISDPAQDIVGSYGSLDWANNGTYSYSLNNANPAVQALAVGETLTDVFTYTVSDGNGGTDTATLTITINGTNDEPVVVTPIGDQSNNDTDTVTPLNVSDNFQDPDTTDVLTYGATGLPPGLALDPNTGIISGTLDRSASQGGTGGVYSITVTATDSQGANVSQTFSWSVANPAPTATNNVGAVTEDGTLTNTGNLITTDTGAGVDSDPDGDPLTIASIDGNATGPAPGTYGTLTWASNGGYTYSLNNANSAVQALAVGETITDTFIYVVSDGNGGTDTATLTITINGTNDVPVVNTAIANQANNDSDPVTVNISGNFQDPDTTDVLTYGATGLPPGLTLDPNTGIISGTIDRSASQGGTGGVYSITVTATDTQGANVSQIFSWSIANPAPTATNNVGAVTEDGTLTSTGNLMTTDTGAGVDNDPDGDPLTIASVNGSATGPAAGSYGTLTWASNGTYTYSLSNANPIVQALAQGETLSEVFTYIVSDGEGGTDTATLTITINGTNDMPVVVTPIGNQTNNDADTVTPLNVSGSFQDPDATDVLTYGATGLPTGLSIDPNTGIISGTLDRSASQGGTGGVYSITVTATDTQGANVPQTFSWSVANLAPTATNNVGAVTEDGTLTNTGNLITTDTGAGVDSDPDNDPLTIASINGTSPGALVGSYGTLTWASNGSYTYSLNNANPAVQGLTLGQTLPDVFTYTLSDSEGGTDTATLTITINGTNDAPVLDLDSSQSGSGYSTLYDPATGPLAIAPATLVIADIDDASMASVTVTLTNRPNGSDERLVVGTLPGGITASAYNPATGQLILSGAASLSDYQSAIAAIAYENTATFPNRQNRTIEITVSDGKDNSNTATTLVQWTGDGVNGTNGNDIIYGVTPDGSIRGLSNPDIFYGFGGDDIITGGSDTDVIYGGSGNDMISAGGGNDSIYGEAGNDIINGGSGNDYLDGGDDDDVITGGSGLDWLLGGNGNDTLIGGSGNDVLIGGPGNDTLIGGQGDDIFKYQAPTEGADTIVDFEIVRDRIDLSAIGGLAMGNLQFQQSGAHTLLSLNQGGETYALATLMDVNASTLASRHFIFAP